MSNIQTFRSSDMLNYKKYKKMKYIRARNYPSPHNSENRTDGYDFLKFTESGNIGIMCPCCNYCDIIQINTTALTNMRYFKDKDTCEYSVGIQPSIHALECPDCGRYNLEMIQIDPSIVNIISILNRKGYYTAFCCEGHPDEWDDEEKAYIQVNPYILFNDRTILEYIDTLPLSWYLDYDQFMTSEPAYRMRPCIRSEYCQQDEAIVELTKWVLSLPKQKINSF